MAGRAAVFDTQKKFDSAGNPCVPSGVTGTYEYGGHTWEMHPRKVCITFVQSQQKCVYVLS